MVSPVSAEGLQGLGVVVGGLGEQVGHGPGDEVGVEPVGGLVDRVGDDLGLLDVDLAFSERGPGRVAGLEGLGRAWSSGGRRVW